MWIYRPETLTDPRKVVLVYTIGSIFDITTHPQLNPISMVKMIGSRWAPNLPILSDFDCLQPRRRFLRYLFENHMGFGDYQDELAYQFSKVYISTTNRFISFLVISSKTKMWIFRGEGCNKIPSFLCQRK